MLLSRSACGLTLLSLIACDAGTDVPGDKGDAPGVRNRMCNLAWGSLLTPAKGEVELVAPKGPNVAPLLLVDADRVSTRGGETQSCSEGNGTYSCEAEGSFQSIVVTLGRLSWKLDNECRWYEDEQNLRLDAPGCIKQNALVVTGALQGFDPDRRQPSVKLQGPRQLIRGTSGVPSGEDDQAYAVRTDCRVEDGHYACPTLGYLHTQVHTVIAGGRALQVELPVSDCAIEEQQRDVQCPAEPAGFSVRDPSSGAFEVTASYENGAPYPCSRALEADEAGEGAFFCPPAPGDPWGRGTYHVVARGNRLIYEGDAHDVFDGCGGSGDPLVLQQRR